MTKRILLKGLEDKDVEENPVQTLGADKTSNVYQIETDKYNKLTTDAITSTYKKLPTKLATKLMQMEIKW